MCQLTTRYIHEANYRVCIVGDAGRSDCVPMYNSDEVCLCNIEYRKVPDCTAHTIITQGPKTLAKIAADIERLVNVRKVILYSTEQDAQKEEEAFLALKPERVKYLRLPYPHSIPGPWQRVGWSLHNPGYTCPFTGIVALEYYRMSLGPYATIWLTGFDIFSNQPPQVGHSKQQTREHLRNVWLWDSRVIFEDALLKALMLEGDD